MRHTAPVAARLARYAGLEVAILSSSAAQDREARAIVGENEGNGPVRFRMLTPGPIARAAGPLLSLAGPFRRIAVLLHNRHHLAGYDAIVVPETTTMLLRDAMGVKTPKLIWIPHGAGDRSVGFRRIAARFDLVLVAGPKVRERMIAEGGGAGAVPDRRLSQV
ncbi:hypothetical protein ACFSTD_02790 [Novosphingobium colocasiae]